MYDGVRQELKFTVRGAQANAGETVCVSGNCEALGNWTLGRVFPLDRRGNGDIWTGTIPILAQQAETLAYRYVICLILEEPTRRVIVRHWETSLKPRIIRSTLSEDRIADQGNERIDRFGLVDENNYEVQNGWMTSETLIQLKLYNNPIQVWKRCYADKKFQVKVTPIDLNRRDSESMVDGSSAPDTSDTECRAWPIVELAVMNEDECEFVLQQQFGRMCDTDEFVVFQAQVLSPETTAFLVDLYVHDLNRCASNAPEHLGYCHILPSVFQPTTGTTIVPITSSKHQPVGQLTVEYLVIRPLEEYDCNLAISYSKHWKRDRKTLDIGHRGSGSSFSTTRHCANIRENTIASLKHATDHGADYVEFDVQLSKDLVPIIYHDFHVCICTEKKYSGDDSELVEVPVQDLTLSQLQELKLHHMTERTRNNVAHSFVRDDHEDGQPFPTLRRALQTVDIHVGFNVEIKWNLQRKDGTHELSNSMEINLYLDVILKELLEKSAERRIVLSCFHPDICTMLPLKQNKYPVLFLTQGQSRKYAPYRDPRTSSIPMAIHYARSAGILGIDVHTEDILEDRSVVQLCKDAKLIMFCWGEDNNDPKVNEELKKLGLDGVIYDRIDEHKTQQENVFLMETKSRKARLELAGVQISDVTPSKRS